MAENDLRFNIIDEISPFNVYLSARYRKSFAYKTMRDRLPVTLTHIIDQIARDKEVLNIEFGEGVRNEIKEILAQLSQLKYELQTDKEFRLFDRPSPDMNIWNNHIQEMSESRSYFSAVWLYAECYFYRRIKAIFEKSQLLKNYDYFQKQKENALISQFAAIKEVSKEISKQTGNNKECFCLLMKLNLWGNRCDLSITSGKEAKTLSSPFAAILDLDDSVLVNQIEQTYECITSGNSNDNIIDIVNDNVGYELFTDLCLADFIIREKIAKTVRFHVKAMPWFISDVNVSDFNWTLKTLRSHPDENVSQLGQRCSDYLFSGKFVLIEPVHSFWTTGYEFDKMKEIDQHLYDLLSESHLIIFKGDLNYRKLLGDFNWKYTTPFQEALRNFRPSNLCSLRTIKADLICGLQSGEAENLFKHNENWMETGEYGVIQFAPKV